MAKNRQSRSWRGKPTSQVSRPTLDTFSVSCTSGADERHCLAGGLASIGLPEGSWLQPAKPEWRSLRQLPELPDIPAVREPLESAEQPLKTATPSQQQQDRAGASNGMHHQAQAAEVSAMEIDEGLGKGGSPEADKPATAVQQTQEGRDDGEEKAPIVPAVVAAANAVPGNFLTSFKCHSFKQAGCHCSKR